MGNGGVVPSNDGATSTAHDSDISGKPKICPSETKIQDISLKISEDVAKL